MRTLVLFSILLISISSLAQEGYKIDFKVKGLKDTTATFPRRLSETGLFTSVKTMEPAPGVVPYSVIASRWMVGNRPVYGKTNAYVHAFEADGAALGWRRLRQHGT